MAPSDTDIERVICTLTGAKEAREGQVKAVRSLLDGHDTVLIAATGYGKSAPLAAVSALTGLITVQIVPLSKLGENQVEEIRRGVPNSTPIWIDENFTLKVKKDLILFLLASISLTYHRIRTAGRIFELGSLAIFFSARSSSLTFDSKIFSRTLLSAG
jgi:hypothetical protein